ncbi:glucose dehydrogenase [FAD, quinone]-like isoform X2 [Hylaeus anthracinus]|uniref:glucose dehydrogenase [FAD, quinone]-like isoform X2 n=1 Tax=Hylaeus anthracinus TaxID=313031 RepID=UPI0023B9A900|nr:glucose dehydrogenase [FAD, quinone]-like isoform X2 [Hylaeus anthracinus]
MATIGRLSALRIAMSFGPELSFLILLRMLINMHRPDIADREHRVKPISPVNIQSSYDFVIIGGGSAGAVMANRLSENGNWTVLLLEAGPDEPQISDVPVALPVLQLSPLDWQFKTEPSEGYCLAMKNRKCNWPRGKVLGGSSVLNAMLYIRGNKKDYDGWEMLGNPGWSYKNVLPYFKKSEDMRIKEFENSPYHQTGGYLTVEHFKYRTPITNYMVKGVTEMGYELVDSNGPVQTGITYSHATVRDGLRCSTAKAFLRSASKRKNLHVSIHSVAEKILVREEGDKKIAYGVQVRVDGALKEVKADREVILSAGSLQSPQVLMLSGIGPKDHLQEMGIPVVHDLPGVGQNLQDHVGMSGLTYLVDPPEDYKGDYPFTFNVPTSITPKAAMDFAMNRSGPFYSSVFTEAIAFVNTKYANASDDYPDVQFLLSPDADINNACLDGLKQNENEFHESWCDDILHRYAYSVTALLLRPRSAGYVKLRSTDPQEHPILVSNYFKDTHDLDVLIDGAKIAHKISETPTMKKLNARLHPNPHSDCDKFEVMSDDHLKCLARHFTRTIYHVSGTCKMGPANDSMAVVDHRLRVHGINGLRVIDTSIMPNVVSGNTVAPTIMISEKGADMVKEDWKM